MPPCRYEVRVSPKAELAGCYQYRSAGSRPERNADADHSPRPKPLFYPKALTLRPIKVARQPQKYCRDDYRDQHPLPERNVAAIDIGLDGREQKAKGSADNPDGEGAHIDDVSGY